MSMQLSKSSTDRILLGVCSGLAAYFKVDPALVRIAFVFLSFISGGAGVLLYIVLAIIMPKQEADAAHPTEVMRDNVRSILREVAAAAREVTDAIRRPPSRNDGSERTQEGKDPDPEGSESTAAEFGHLSSEIREEVRVHVAARKELGPEYEDNVVESLVQKVEKALNARMDTKNAQARASVGRQSARSVNPLGLLAICMCLGIPLTAVAGGLGGLPGIISVWGAVGFLVIYFHHGAHQRQ